MKSINASNILWWQALVSSPEIQTRSAYNAILYAAICSDDKPGERATWEDFPRSIVRSALVV